MAYIDTSVLAAAYCPELLSEAAERIIRDDRHPVLSLLTEVEFCSAISLKKRMGDIDAGAAGRILSLFRSHTEDGLYELVPVEAPEYARAAKWISSFDTSLRTLDALHLATAESHGLQLVTADKSLARAAEHFGVKHLLVSP